MHALDGQARTIAFSTNKLLGVPMSILPVIVLFWLAAFFLRKKDGRGIFMVFVAAISAAKAITYFDGETDGFVGMMMVSSAIVGGSLAGLLCRLLLGPSQAVKKHKFMRGENIPTNGYQGYHEEPICERYVQDDLERKLPNLPGDPSINTTWPNVQ